MDIFLLDLETVIVSLILISLSIYAFYAYYEFASENNIQSAYFINNIIISSIIWVSESIIIVLVILFKARLENNTLLIRLIFFVIFIFSSAVILACIQFIQNRKVKLIPILPVLIVITIMVSVFVIIPIPLIYLFYISLILYIINIFIFAISTFKLHPNTSKIGTIYIGIGTLVILAIHYFSDIWGFRFSVFLDLAVSVFLFLGFFIYYNDLYLLKISEQINQIRQNDKKMVKIAYTDQITSLDNKYKLEKDIKHIHKGYLIMINLENFTSINNLIGYNNGNKILKEIATIFKENSQHQYKIYRSYSDKFIIYLNENYKMCKMLVNAILEIFKTNMFNGIVLTSYIGITEIKKHNDFDTLLKELEISSTIGKKSPLKYAYYEDKYSLEFEKQLQLKIDLKEATKNKDWAIVYQPKVSIINNKTEGVEALIRWKNNCEYIPPDIFIPLAENLGLINEIGKFVIDTVFNDVRNLNCFIKNPINVSINLSAYQLMDKNFYESVLLKAEEYNIITNQIIFEITETTLIHNIENVNETIEKLKKAGFKFSMDDFGTGYSSLYYICNLNLDEVKFDKKFADDLLKGDKNMIMIETLTNMFKKFGIQTVVEGVESKEQLECLKKIGCHLYQGYYFSKPIAYEQIIQMYCRTALNI